MSTETTTATAQTATQAMRRPLALSLLRLARPHQWSKGIFVLAGPVYGCADLIEQGARIRDLIVPSLIILASFSLAASGCYVVNDIFDAESDRRHPRKRNRPIASGAVTPGQARVFAALLLLGSLGLLALLPAPRLWWAGATVALYIANVMTYSAFFKKHAIADVMGLSLGFVLRVLGGCAALGIGPSSWLLNVTLFIAMFLAFGKRLGERRSMGELAAQTRSVQGLYTSTLLEMAVVVTGVCTLVTYTIYVEGQASYYTLGFNLLWLTVLPVTFVLLRCIVLLDAGRYDDPTEIALRDPVVRGGTLLFSGMTAFLMLWFRLDFGDTLAGWLR
ncbi:MAG: UbiA prenyltransferase family protein [Phycisphaeraceae bacterium]|nr:UbiA prenyltransferase family protein [Phycisphaeraceae bacterium]